MALPAPFGMSFETLESILRNIGKGQRRGFSLHDAQLLMALDLAEEAPESSPARCVVLDAAPISNPLLAGLVIGLES